MKSLFGDSLTIHDTYNDAAELVLHIGDARDFVTTLPSDSVQLILTSPPYNLGKSYETQVSIEHYLQAQASLIQQLVRTLRPGGSLCWQVGNFVQDGEVFPLDIYYYPIFKAEGLRLRNRIIWHFGHGLHASKRFSGRYETLLWFTKGGSYVFNLDAVRVPSKYPGKRHYKGNKKGQPSGNPNGKNPSDVWEVLLEDWESCLWDIPNVKSNHPEKTSHPCQFPVELVERCVLALTHEDDLVFDPYAGVGSTLIGARRHQRRAMGCEKEPAYVAIAHDRLQRWANGTLKTRAIGQPIHQPTGREVIEAQHKPLLDEVYDVIAGTDSSACKTKISKERSAVGQTLYSPRALNKAFKARFGALSWQSYRVDCDYPRQFYTTDYDPPRVGIGAYREIDFIKARVGVEVQFGKYSFMVYNVCAKMTIFHKQGVIDVGIEIVPVKAFAAQMSSGVSYFEQFVWDLEARGIADIDIPVLVLGVNE